MSDLEYNSMLEDIVLERGSIEEIAAQYNKPPNYIANIRSKVLNLKYEPRIEDDRLVCYHCGRLDKPFHIHHVHGVEKREVWVAILCNECNYAMGNAEYFGARPVESSYTDNRIRVYEQELLKLLRGQKNNYEWGLYLEERIKELL